MDTGILFVSHDNQVVYTNPAFTRIWMIAPGTRLIGRSPQEALATSACALARPEEQGKRVLRLPREGEILGTLEIQMADGRLITQQMHSVEDVYGRPVGHLWLFQDVTRERQTADQLIYLAERDALTGLYNRHRFNEELARMIADAQRHDSRVALLFFDLDDFKYINDTFGHRAGDAMLIRVAGEVAGQVRRNEIFARLGGDEFAILVPEISDEMLRVLAERITRSIALVRFQFEGQNLRLTSSLGIAVYPDHADNAEDLIARADTAMYQAKEAGKNAWRIYRSDLDTTSQMVQRLSWNDRILHALENDLMDLQFQGVYATADRSLSHFEVLVRMRDKDDPAVLLMPGQFIPVAEKSGKILDIDRWVLRESIQMLGGGEVDPGARGQYFRALVRRADAAAVHRRAAEALRRRAAAADGGADRDLRGFRPARRAALHRGAAPDRLRRVPRRLRHRLLLLRLPEAPAGGLGEDRRPLHPQPAQGARQPAVREGDRDGRARAAQDHHRRMRGGRGDARHAEAVSAWTACRATTWRSRARTTPCCSPPRACRIPIWNCGLLESGAGCNISATLLSYPDASLRTGPCLEW